MRALPILLLSLAGIAAQVGCGPGDDGGDSCSGIVVGDLVLTEVLGDYDAPSGSSGVDEGKEWFEIHNASSAPIELAGVVLEHGRPTDTDPKRHVMRAVTIPAGGYLVMGNVLPDLAPSHVDYGYANDLGDLFNTDGGRLALRCGTVVVDEAAYGSTVPGRTFSLDGGSAPDYQANDDLANWCETEETATFEYEPANFGTPGGPNQDCMVVQPGLCDDGGTMRPTVPPQVGDLTITEIMPDPTAAGDATGEWFEVRVNRDVDINDLGIARATGTPTVLASATCVRATAGTYLVFAKSNVPGTNGGIDGVDGTFTFDLANGGGTVRVLMGTTELDTATWASVRPGRSTQLDMGLVLPTDNDLSTNFCDGTVAYGAGDLGTPGLENSDCGVVTTGMCLDTGTQLLRPIVKPTAGQLVIDEWMPDPTHVGDAAGEWFEVRSTADVDLNGLQAGGATLGTTPLIPAAGDCVRVTTGNRAMFARTRTNPAAVPPTDNGLPDTVTLAATFGFGLTNGASSFQIGIDGGNLATATWGATSVPGSSWMRDTDGTQCSANLTTPAPLPAYNHGAAAGTDRGTPGAVNSPPECP